MNKKKLVWMQENLLNRNCKVTPPSLIYYICH